MKKRSIALIRKLKERKRRHHADSTSHMAPDPRNMPHAMANMMSNRSGSGRSTIATASSAGSSK